MRVIRLPRRHDGCKAVRQKEEKQMARANAAYDDEVG
jgi:hypothetical protein